MKNPASSIPSSSAAQRARQPLRHGLLGAALLLAPLPGLATNAAPSASELANASYSGIDGQDITLSDGRWQGAPFVEGGASRPSAGLVEGFQLDGDLNGDGNDEAVVLLWQSSGGSGVFSYIAAMGRKGEEVINLGTAPIGDRVQVRAGHVADGSILLDVVQQASDDAACCPSQLATRHWTLGKGLQEGPTEITGTLSLATLGGPAGGQLWRLTRLASEQPLADDIDITLQLNDDKIVGKGGCNRYFAAIKAGDVPGGIGIGPVGSTQMACPEQLAGAEHRYLDLLGSIDNFRFLGGQLVLGGSKDGQHFTLRFVAQESGQ